MVLKRTALLGSIADGLGRLRSSCEQRGFLGFFDTHIAAQYFFRRLLNAAFGLKLVDMDHIKPNHPAIDLGDSEDGIAYQITSESGGTKVQHTLDKFVQHGLEKKYHRLVILVIGERLKSYSTVRVPAGLPFDPATDVIGIPELVRQLHGLDTPVLTCVQAVLDEELSVVGTGVQPLSPLVCLEPCIEAFNLKTVDIDPPDAIRITLRGRFVVTNTSKVTATLWKVKAKIIPYNGALSDWFKEIKTPSSTTRILPGDSEKQIVEFDFRVPPSHCSQLPFVLRSLIASQICYQAQSENTTSEEQMVFIWSVTDTTALVANIENNLRIRMM